MLTFILALIVIAIDQISKYWIMSVHVAGTLGYAGAWNDIEQLRSFLIAADAKNMIPQNATFLSLSFTPNDAALWGIGNGNPWAVRLLIALTSVFLFLLMFFTIRTRKKLPTLSRVILGLLVGGSVGNLYDRIAFGYVRDMIKTEFMDFPVFNIADSAICVAIALLIFEALFKKTGVFECFEDECRYLFRMPTREEAAAAAKERKKNRISRFEELIPEEESEEPDEKEGPDKSENAEESDGNGNDSADCGDGSGED